MIKFSDIELAFEFVSGASYGMNSCTLCKETGQIYYESGLGDSDELPDDIDDDEKYVSIPHKNDLDLGFQLVREFVSKVMPEKFNQVEHVFRGKGAYSQYKAYLVKNDLLDEWYAFEADKTKATLRYWCAKNNINIEEGDASGGL